MILFDTFYSPTDSPTTLMMGEVKLDVPEGGFKVGDAVAMEAPPVGGRIVMYMIGAGECADWVRVGRDAEGHAVVVSTGSAFDMTDFDEGDRQPTLVERIRDWPHWPWQRWRAQRELDSAWPGGEMGRFRVRRDLSVDFITPEEDQRAARQVIAKALVNVTVNRHVHKAPAEKK